MTHHACNGSSSSAVGTNLFKVVARKLLGEGLGQLVHCSPHSMVCDRFAFLFPFVFLAGEHRPLTGDLEGVFDLPGPVSVFALAIAADTFML